MAIDINIPSQVKTYANLAGFPATGSLKTIFIAEDTNKTYRWTGSAYVEISASQATSWGTITGTLSNQTDLQTALNAKQDSLGFTAVPTTRTLTINGTTQDLSADRTFTISTGITIGTTAIASGTVGRILFEGTGNVVQESANLFWDNTNGRLGIGTSSPTYKLEVSSTSGQATSGLLVKNSGSGISDYSSLNFANNGATISQIFLTSSTYAVAGLAVIGANGFGHYTNGSNGMTLWADGGILKFVTGSGAGALNTQKMTLFTTGNLGINTTTDAGFKLDVNGTARVSGNLTLGAEIFGTTNTYFNGPSANTGNLWLRFSQVNSVSQIKIGTSAYSDVTSALIMGLVGSGAARGTLASTNNYQDFQFVKTDVASGNINSWNFGQRQDTYFGNSLGSFQIVGSYTDNAGIASMVGGGYRVPLICNPNGDIIISGASNSINGNISFGSTTVASSALVSITSTTKGFLPPRMTTTQKNAIASPATGLMVYDTTLNLISVYNGTIWISL